MSFDKPDTLFSQVVNFAAPTATVPSGFCTRVAQLLGTNLELLQLEAQVDQFDHSVLLSLRVLWKFQDQFFTLFYGEFQLFDVRRNQ